MNRIFILVKKNYNNQIPHPGDFDNIDLDIISKVKKTTIIIDQDFNNLKIHDGIENTLSILRLVNKYLELKKPWKTVLEDNQQKSESATTLYIAAEILRIATCFLYPIMPNKAGDIICALDKRPNDGYEFDTSFGILKSDKKIDELNNIFPRIL